MEQYLNLVQRILDEGQIKENRTGVAAITIPGTIFEHDMSKGFPLVTTKKMAHKSIRVELEGFIKGVTDKEWFKEKGCNIWDRWCSPEKVPYGHDEETKKRMLEERDLGPIYGFQWRHSGADYRGYNSDYTGQGVDQLAKVISTMKTSPEDRRMVVSAWNQAQLHQMALPPCHYAFQVVVVGNKLNLLWSQRSVDAMLGLPFNIASYAVLLKLLAKEGGFEEGRLVGFLGDFHIYENHLDGAKKQLAREPFPLPRAEIPNFTSTLEWNHTQFELYDYQHHPKIDFKIAV